MFFTKTAQFAQASALLRNNFSWIRGAWLVKVLQRGYDAS
jgi:hypothetical protein